MEIKKIELDNSQNNQRVSHDIPSAPASSPHDRVTVSKKTTFFMQHKILIGVIVILFVLLTGSYMFLKKFIIWEESSQIVKKETVSVRASQDTNRDTKPVKKSDTPRVQVKGRITVTLTREEGRAFDKAVIRLKTTSGKVVREEIIEQKTTVVFDEIPEGTYIVEGGKFGEARLGSKTVNLDAGEITRVSLSILLDEPVSVTVHIATPDGGSLSNTPLTLTRIRSEQEDESKGVTTNASGSFTLLLVPDDNWIIKKDGSEIARFRVSPSGQAQTINVTSTSN